MQNIVVLVSAVAIVAASIGLLLGLRYVSDSIGCRSRWSGSAYEARYQFPGGCQVRKAGGSWVPERVVRDVN